MSAQILGRLPDRSDVDVVAPMCSRPADGGFDVWCFCGRKWFLPFDSCLECPGCEVECYSNEQGQVMSTDRAYSEQVGKYGC